MTKQQTISNIVSKPTLSPNLILLPCRDLQGIQCGIPFDPECTFDAHLTNAEPTAGFRQRSMGKSIATDLGRAEISRNLKKKILNLSPKCPLAGWYGLKVFSKLLSSKLLNSVLCFLVKFFL